MVPPVRTMRRGNAGVGANRQFAVESQLISVSRRSSYGDWVHSFIGRGPRLDRGATAHRSSNGVEGRSFSFLQPLSVRMVADGNDRHLRREARSLRRAGRVVEERSSGSTGV